jgi:hypothetical protein
MKKNEKNISINIKDTENFKSCLWKSISSDCCQGSRWCYSYSEKKLFFLVLGVLVSLGTVVFISLQHTQEYTSIREQLHTFQISNEDSLDALDNDSDDLQPNVNTVSSQ